MQNKEIMVSICCLAYNHEKYICDALDSFLMQKTDFSFEILIHDDASTDKTADIIRKYEKKFPHIVKPIYQKENQYSKGKKISATIQYPRAQGKYIAMCEGDDFWTDEYKLQKQVDYMEQNPLCALCVHASKIVDVNKNIIENHIPYASECNLETEELIQRGGDLFSTNSMLFRSEFTKHFPKFYLDAHIGDYPLTIFLSLCGQVHYYPSIMSAYRRGVPGSWSENEKTNMFQSKINLEKMIELYRNIDEYTNGRYNSTLEQLIKDAEIILKRKNLILKFPGLYKVYKKLFRE